MLALNLNVSHSLLFRCSKNFFIFSILVDQRLWNLFCSYDFPHSLQIDFAQPRLL